MKNNRPDIIYVVVALSTGINDLATVNPKLAKEVSPNSKIKATEVTAGSGKRLLWRCSIGGMSGEQ